MKTMIATTALIAGLTATTAMADDDGGSMFAGGFEALMGGGVLVTNIGEAQGDQTLVESISVKDLEAGFFAGTDGEDSNLTAFLSIYGSTQGLAAAMSSSDDGSGSMAGTAEMGTIHLEAYGGLWVYEGGSAD